MLDNVFKSNMNTTSLNETLHLHEVGIETNQNKIEKMKTKSQIQKLLKFILKNISKDENLNKKTKKNLSKTVSWGDEK